MKKKRLIPFSWMPGSFGLSGAVYEEAEANYYYEGEELDRKIADIKLKDEPKLLKLRHLALDLKYNKITKYEHDVQEVKLSGFKENEEKLELLKVDYEHEKIDFLTYEKESFTLEGKPWVGVVNQKIDPEHGPNGFTIELDWNDYWIEFLRMHDYTGETEDDIVAQWFSDVNNSPEVAAGMFPLARKG